MTNQLPPGAVARPRGATRPNTIDQSRTDMPLNLPANAVPRPFVAPAAPVAQPDTSQGFLERSAELLKPRYERQQRMTQEYLNGVVDSPEYYTSRVANSMGAFFDVAGEGLLTVLSAITPDRWERLFKENLVAGGTALMSTEQAQQLLELWDGFDQLTKDRIANLSDTAAGASQFAKSPTSVAGQKLSASAVKADKKGLADKVLDQTTEARQARGKDRTKPPNKRFQTNFDEDVLNTVISLPGVTGTTKLPKLLDKLGEAEQHLNSKIKKALVSSEITVPVKEIDKLIDIKLKQLVAEKPEFGDDKQLQNIVKRIKALNKSALKGYTGKPIELLQARRSLDRILSSTFGDNLYEGTSTSRTVAKEFRDTYNELMQGLPDVSDDMKVMMQRQHHLLEAIDNASYANTKTIPKNLLQKAGGVVERHPFIAAGLLGISEAGPSLMNVPPGLLAAGAAGLGIYGLTTPNVRRVAGEALQAAPVSTGLLYGTSNMPGMEPQQ